MLLRKWFIRVSEECRLYVRLCISSVLTWVFVFVSSVLSQVLWLVKPRNRCCGEGIRLVDDPKKIDDEGTLIGFIGVCGALCGACMV